MAPSKLMKNLLFTALFLINSGASLAADVGQAAPSCPAVLAETGKGLDPSHYQGKVVLIDFWATWCPPCIKSMPFFNSLRKELQQNGFEILAVNVDEDSEAARDFLKTNPVDYPIAFDASGECPKIFELKAMPSSYLLDKSGQIRKIFLGYRDADQAAIRAEIQALLAR